MSCTCNSVTMDPHCQTHGGMADPMRPRRPSLTEFGAPTAPVPPIHIKPAALDVQVGGGHYKGKAIQPVEYIHANNLGFLEGCIVKRITRWREKDGVKDLEKIKHEVDLLIELEQKHKNKGVNT